MPVVRFSKDHEYISVDGDVATVGITDYAQSQLGDVVFVELPATGKALKQGDEAAVVESVKAASEVYAPVSGTVVAVNETLPDAPSAVNEDPLGKGWFFRIKLANPAELEDGPARLRIGLRPEGRAPVREGAVIKNSFGDVVGSVTSGGFGPSLGAPVAMGYVLRRFAEPGTALTVDLRGKDVPATVVPLPFVPHRYKKP